MWLQSDEKKTNVENERTSETTNLVEPNELFRICSLKSTRFLSDREFLFDKRESSNARLNATNRTRTVLEHEVFPRFVPSRVETVDRLSLVATSSQLNEENKM